MESRSVGYEPRHFDENRIRQQNGESNKNERYRRDRCQHGAARHFPADGTTSKTTEEHHQPVSADDCTCHRQLDGNSRILVGQILLKEVRNAHFNAHIEEDCEASEKEIAMTQGRKDRDFFLDFAKVGRFGQAGEVKNQSGYCENAHSKVEHGVCR